MADQRALYTEEAVGANHPTKTDVINRLALVSHDNDGTLKDGIVTAIKLAADAVETAKIKDLNVTAAKLAANAVETAKIKNLNVTTAKIEDLNVTVAKLAANAVETAKIKDLNVTAAKLAANAVETAKIKNLNVTAAKLAANAVETAKIKDLNVTAAKLAADQVRKNFGSYVAKSYATLYQAAEDGFVVGEVYADNSGDCGDIDGTEGPTSGSRVKRVSASVRHGGTVSTLVQHNSFCMPVKSGNYWLASARNSNGTCVFTLWWVPLE